ncbi:MAG: PIN domain-containing protein [Ardenticatenaceae bacterium]|nr:PIN domain-containing protein [Anaerolineales bacterium]MCB8922683.1 PIN domain-containing protein [Ardenticatenaceae bacterium]MCB8991770.1 PIN domain-containing protein [Ardenticatenaceae bacterium]MCB9003609.1 PIN domain-containing protein [Ardenticatenaceae bacterium]
MKIYLDTCSIHRPLDSKNQIRILLEADAILGILALCDAGDLELISSEVLLFETNRNPNPIRREHALATLAKASKWVQVNDEIETRARDFIAVGIKPLDALHLSSAEAARVDYFCTCDDRFLKKAQNIKHLHVKVVSPIALIEELEA